jgi:hypothetical protein
VEWTYEFVDGPFELIATLAGRASVEEMLRGRARLLADARLRPGLTALWDLTAIDASGLDHDDVYALASDLEPVERLRLRALALAAPRPLAFGLSRMFQSYGSRFHLAEHVTVVESVEEAYRWLAQLGPPPTA